MGDGVVIGAARRARGARPDRGPLPRGPRSHHRPRSPGTSGTAQDARHRRPDREGTGDPRSTRPSTAPLHEGHDTVVGAHCLLMATCHVAHDCVVGDHVIMINGAALTGHVTVEDRATVGGLGGVHPFTRVGTFAYVGGLHRGHAGRAALRDGGRRARASRGGQRHRHAARGHRRAWTPPGAGEPSASSSASGLAHRRRRGAPARAGELADGSVARRIVTFIEGSQRGIVGAGAAVEANGAELSGGSSEPHGGAPDSARGWWAPVTWASTTSSRSWSCGTSTSSGSSIRISHGRRTLARPPTAPRPSAITASWRGWWTWPRWRCPHERHFDVSRDLLEAGVHVLVESP